MNYFPHISSLKCWHSQPVKFFVTNINAIQQTPSHNRRIWCDKHFLLYQRSYFEKEIEAKKLYLPRFGCLGGCNGMDTQTMGNVLQFLDSFCFGFMKVCHFFNASDFFKNGIFSLTDFVITHRLASAQVTDCSTSNWDDYVLEDIECVTGIYWNGELAIFVCSETGITLILSHNTQLRYGLSMLYSHMTTV